VEQSDRTKNKPPQKKIPLPGGELELKTLETLWSLGRAHARDVHERIGAPAGLAYTTIATVLDRLNAKGLVRRERDGKAFVYFPKVEKRILDRVRAKDALSRLLGDEEKPAIAALVDALESIDPTLLDELGRQVAERRKTREP
jgi:predicted transcriptional regulator